MRLLLDTHIWLWSTLDRARLSNRLITVLENSNNELWLSPISLWEVLTLCQKQRLTLHPNPNAWIANALDAVPMPEMLTSRSSLCKKLPACNFRIAIPPTVFWWPRHVCSI